MDPNSSLGKICLGNDVIKISSDKVEGSGDWNPLEYQDIADSKGKKVTKAINFYKMETDEVRLVGKVNENVLANIGSDINTMPYQIYETLGREEMKKVDRGITMINHTQTKAMGILFNVLCQVGVTTIIAKFIILDIPIDRDAPIVVGRGFLLWEHTMMKPDYQDPNALDNMKSWKKYCFHKFTMNFCYGKVMGCDGEIDDMLRISLREAGSDEEIFTSVALGLYQAAELDEEGFNVYFEGVLRVIHKMITYGLCQRTTEYDKIQNNNLWLLSMSHARHQNGYANVAWLIARWMKRKGTGTQKESQICCGQFILKIARKSRVLTDDVLRSLSALVYCRDLDTTTLRELIDSQSRLIPEDPQPGVPRVGIPRPPREFMQDL
nr:hypothetical protein [Tanacetum cinerariifolium]